ncbi:hypothetical protein [Hymenobacter sp. BT491]|uniref:hypothetical protein n=1 Tax=Hymenobacter sp. BT491 TaxID=2766779 RepID=UPI001653527A|nr:hypothetical protein [Hymenobacter sp. BT491]MBC6988942.1 hypothetical protein [Hymenobacter sp. BT491]
MEMTLEQLLDLVPAGWLIVKNNARDDTHLEYSVYTDWRMHEDGRENAVATTLQEALTQALTNQGLLS